MVIYGIRTLGCCSMLCLEVLEILLVSLVIWRLLILSQFCIIFLFRKIGLSLASFALVGRQNLPSFPNYLCDLGKGVLLAF
jgi:hypothetical protein